MRLVVVLALVSIVASMGVNLFIAEDQASWFENSSLNNKHMSSITSWIHCGLIAFMTFATFYTVFELREEARDLYKTTEKEKCRVKDNEWLRARTLHVRGLLPKDRRGDMLKNELNMMLKSVNGRVLEVVVVPDF